MTCAVSAVLYVVRLKDFIFWHCLYVLFPPCFNFYLQLLRILRRCFTLCFNCSAGACTVDFYSHILSISRSSVNYYCIAMDKGPSGSCETDDEPQSQAPEGLPPIDKSFTLNRDSFKRTVPMLAVGLVCNNQTKQTCAKLHPYFPSYIRIPKLTYT